MVEKKAKYKRSTVKIPKITPSNSEVQFRKDTEKLIKRLERLESGPFGIKKWFKKE